MTTPVRIDDEALEKARGAVRSQSIYAPLGDITTLAEVAVRAYLTALPTSAERVPDEWQPIETAPKDGTKILGYDPTGINDPTFAVIYWYEHESYSYSETSNGLFERETHKCDFWSGADYSPFRATHWRPLPAAPSHEGGGE
jgi:hypothetical protein